MENIESKVYIGEDALGIPRINQQLKDAGLRELEFIGGDTDLRINIYRGQNADVLQYNTDNTEIIDKLPKNCRQTADK